VRPKTLDDFTGEWKQTGDQRTYRTCPVCKDSRWKTVVDPESGNWICFTGVCGAKGRVGAEGAAGLRSRLFTRDRGVHTFSAIDLPECAPLPLFWVDWASDTYQVAQPENYLLQLGHGELEARIVIPYAGVDGSIIGWNARSTDGALPKYKMMAGPKPLYIPQLVCQKNVYPNTIFVVEGAFDAMSVHSRLLWNAVSLGGKTLASHLVPHFVKYVGRRDIRIVLDRDATRDAIKLMHMLKGKLPSSDIQVRMCPAKDPAEATTEQLRSLTCVQSSSSGR